MAVTHCYVHMQITNDPIGWNYYLKHGAVMTQSLIAAHSNSFMTVTHEYILGAGIKYADIFIDYQPGNFNSP